MSWSGYFACGGHWTVARGEVAKAWPPRGLRVLITEPLSTDRIAVREWGLVGRLARAQTKSYSNWLATILPGDGMPQQSRDMSTNLGQRRMIDCDLEMRDALLPIYQQLIPKFIWIGCENVGRGFQSGGPKMPMMTKPMIRRSLFLCPFIFAPWATPLFYDSGDSIFCSSEEDMEEGGAKNSKRPKEGLLCESTAKAFHISGASGVSETKSRKK